MIEILDFVNTERECASSQLTCAIAPDTSVVDYNDLIGLVCKSGPHYGDIGRVMDYRAERFTLAFSDGQVEHFRGPKLNALRKPSLGEYEVEPFYIGDLAKNRGFSSKSHNGDEIYLYMKTIHRTHVGLMRLSRQIGENLDALCARRVHDILMSSQKHRLTGVEK